MAAQAALVKSTHALQHTVAVSQSCILYAQHRPSHKPLNLTCQQWYMPKDSPSTGLGHRHDWEGIVVWLSAASTSAQLLGVAASAHGDFDTTTSPNLSGTSPLIRYYSTYPVNHQLGFTSTVGGQQPLIAYESLTSAARSALENTDFGESHDEMDERTTANMRQALPMYLSRMPTSKVILERRHCEACRIELSRKDAAG